MNPLEQLLATKLKEREANGNLRSLSIAGSEADFFSNDYLGLASTGLLNKLIQDTYTEAGGTGSTGSRLLSGNNTEVEALENTIATHHGAQAALVYNSGYDANIGLIAAIGHRHTTILYDELCHASIIDGVRLSQTQNTFKFRHNDIADLSEKLQRHSEKGPLIVITESVFSMDGDTAHLELIAPLCSAYNAQLIVDEAHATGVFGNRGAGLVCALGLQDQVFARVHTFGKALGCHGAVVVGSATLRQYLINYSRSFIYTTALPVHSIRAIACAYQHLASPVYTAQPLHDLIAYFRHSSNQRNITGFVDSNSPVQAYITGSNESANHLAAQLLSAGLQIKAIRSPTVPKGSERLRMCLHTFNTHEQIDILMKVLSNQ